MAAQAAIHGGLSNGVGALTINKANATVTAIAPTAKNEYPINPSNPLYAPTKIGRAHV